MEFIKAKSIVQYSTYKDKWFGIDYNMNLYKGCPHGCIYCDSRSNCYHVDDFDRVRIKDNCIQMLSDELKRKRRKGVIGIGSMSDAYNPLEKKYEITRKALEAIKENGFGISIDTKSSLITRDIDIFKEINEEHPVILKVTITSADDNLSKIIEPNVCASSERFKAIKELADAGIFVGVLLTPIIPFITDDEKNIINIIKEAKINGAKFIYTIGGVTLRENQREYFYEKLDEKFPQLKKKYMSTFKDGYACYPINKNLMKVFKETCEKYGLLYKMDDIIKAYKYEKNITKNQQISFFR